MSSREQIESALVETLERKKQIYQRALANLQSVLAEVPLGLQPQGEEASRILRIARAHASALAKYRHALQEFSDFVVDGFAAKAPRPGLKTSVRVLTARYAEEVELLFEMLPVGIAIAYDPACREIRSNSVYTRMLGLNHPSPFRVFRNGKEVAVENLPMQFAAREGVPVNDSRCEIHRGDGTVLIVRGSVQPLFSDSGRTRGSIGVFTDVTPPRAIC